MTKRWSAWGRFLWLSSLLLLIGAGCARLPAGRYAIDSVDIERVDAEDERKVPESDIEGKIATASSPKFLGVVRGFVFDYELFDRYVLERDLARIERIYRARGYYEAHVRAGRVERTKDGHVKVTIVVEEGRPVDVGDVRLGGITALPLDTSAAVLAAVRKHLQSGKPFDEGEYEAAQDDLIRALGDRGYAFAQVKGGAEVDLNRHVADVVLMVTPGETARIGKLTVTGLGDLPEKPVRRALDLSEGELYSTSKLESARRAILALGVFSDVEVTPVLTGSTSRTVPVNVRLVPSELHAVKAGGGIELDVIRTDLHLLGGWEDHNFLGGLRRLTIDTRPGVVLFPTRLPTLRKPTKPLLENRARAELRQPGFIEARTGGILRGEFNIYPVPLLWGDEEQPSDIILGYRDLSSGVGLDRTFGPFYASLFYNFQTSFPFSYAASLPKEFKKVVISYVDLQTNLDLRDDAIRPHVGLFVGNNLQFAGLPVTSNFRGTNADTLFPRDLRVQPEVRGYIPLAKKWTLALRATTGFLFPLDYGESLQSDVPSPDDIQLVFFRGLFSGGPNSNRGYAYRGVGPKQVVPIFVPGVIQLVPACINNVDSLDCKTAIETFCKNNPDHIACKFPSGGLSLWEASVELRFPIIGELEGALFCDASDVSRFRYDIRLLYPHFSCGAGLHYQTPVGPIRLDTGFQIPGLQVLDRNPDPADQPSDQGWAIAIGIGEAF
ncbi:MAG TPA: POTRA domain-containing protein [Polyangiaceae bacterium]